MSKVAIIRSKLARIGPFFGRIGRFLGLILDDILALAGLAVIVATNFRVHELFGWYSLGVVLLVLGVAFARLPRRNS